MKRTWIITATAVILFLAVLFAATRVVFYTDQMGFHVADRNAAEIYVDKDAWRFEDIELQTTNSKIEVISADRFGFEFMVGSTIDTVYKNENNKLTITQSSKDLLFNFNLWPTEKDYVKIYVPERVALKNVKITGENEAITIENLKAENVDIMSLAGNITVTIIGEKKDYKSDISADGGTVTVDGNVVESYQYQSDDAKKSINIKSTSGDVTINFKGQ